MLNWLTKLLGLENKLIHSAIYKMPARNRKIKGFLRFTFVKGEWNILVSRDLPVPITSLWVLSSLPRSRFWGAKLTGFMEKGDNGKMGYCQSQHKSIEHPGQNAQCNQTDCLEAVGEVRPAWSFPCCVEASSRAGIWRSDNQWKANQYNVEGGGMLCSFQAEIEA